MALAPEVVEFESMDWVSGALISVVTLMGLETSAEFTEVWYREVLLGEVRNAASTYDCIYTLRAPWQGSTEDERRIAALRAGLCLESLGRVAEARFAYDWLLQHGLHGSAIVDLARARLGAMARSGMLPSDGEPYATTRIGEVSLVRDALADHLNMAGDELERGGKDLESLRGELARLTEEVRLMRSLRDRLETQGAAVMVGGPGPVVLTPESRRTAVGSQPSSGFRPTLEAELRAVLAEGFSFEGILPGVADAFCGAALRAVSAGDPAAARRHFEQTLALAGQHGAALDFVQKLDSGQDSRRLGDLAGRYLLEERLRRIGDLQGQIRDRLVRARQARRDAGVVLVIQIWQMVDRALPEVRQEAEIAYLVREADRLFEALTTGVSGRDDERAPGEELRELLEERRGQIETARGLVREIVEVTFEKLAMERATGDQARADTIRVVADELQRLFAESRNFLAKGDVKEGAASLRQAELLLSWFPAVDDARGHYRIQSRRLRQNLELKREVPALQKELDNRK